MNRITKSAIEDFAIELLEMSDYQYAYAPDIAQITKLQNGQDLKMFYCWNACKKPLAE